jgi:hypothetical protein
LISASTAAASIVVEASRPSFRKSCFDNEEVWSNLGNTLSDLRQSVDSQAQRLDALKTRRAARLRLRKSE